MTTPSKPDPRGELLRVCKTCGKTQGEHGPTAPYALGECAGFVPGDRYDFSKRRINR